MKWTERQFQKAMRDAGWKNHGQGCHIHTRTDAKFMAWTFEPRIQGEAWKEFAAAAETPAPF